VELGLGSATERLVWTFEDQDHSESEDAPDRRECAPMATSVSDRGEGGRAGHLVQAPGGGVQRPAQTVVVEQRGGHPQQVMLA
jgi:hypothetical protein